MGHQKNEDLTSVKKEVKLYLANLNAQLLELLRALYRNPTIEIEVKHKEEVNPRFLLQMFIPINSRDKIEYVLPKTIKELFEAISFRISSIQNVNTSDEEKKFLLKGLVMNNYDGYPLIHFNSTDVKNLDLQLAQTGITLLTRSPELGHKAQRLLIRLSTISKLNDALNAYKPINLKSEVETAVAICKANKPTWSEQPFLNKLKDILSLGIRYMFFHQDETKTFKEKVTPFLASPTPKK